MRNVVRARRNLLGKKNHDNENNEENIDLHPGETKDSCDTSRILKVLEDCRCGLERKIDEMNRNSNEKSETMKNEMKNELEKMRNNFENRREGLAKRIETKVSKAIEKELEEKVKGIRNGIDNEIQKIKSSNDKIVKSVAKLEETTLRTFKEEIGDEMDELNRRMKSLEEKVSTSEQSHGNFNSGDDLKRNIIIKHLDGRENENLKDRVNSLIYNDLKLDKIRVESATRKPTKRDSKPGVIVAVCKTMMGKESIMRKKSDLKKSRLCENVYIEHHLPPEQRRLNNNLRTIVNTIGSDRLRLKGSRVLQTDVDRDYAQLVHISERLDRMAKATGADMIIGVIESMTMKKKI